MSLSSNVFLCLVLESDGGSLLQGKGSKGEVGGGRSEPAILFQNRVAVGESFLQCADEHFCTVVGLCRIRHSSAILAVNLSNYWPHRSAMRVALRQELLVDDAFAIPPNTDHDLQRVQSCQRGSVAVQKVHF